MSHLPLGGLGTVLDLGKQLRFDPDVLVRDPFGIGLRLANEWLEPLAQLGSRCLINAVVTRAVASRY
jgi:hypothetical protein